LMGGPPSWIPQGTVSRFVLQDPKPSSFGSEGTVAYTYCDTSLAMSTVVFSFECPTGIANNRAASSQAEWSCVAKSSNPNDPWTTPVPAGGHPLYVAYAIEPSEGAWPSVRLGADVVSYLWPLLLDDDEASGAGSLHILQLLLL